MAITRAQQFRQMLEDGGMLVQPSTTGKRPGYRRSKTDASGGGLRGSAKDPGSPGPGDSGGDEPKGLRLRGTIDRRPPTITPEPKPRDDMFFGDEPMPIMRPSLRTRVVRGLGNFPSILMGIATDNPLFSLIKKIDVSGPPQFAGLQPDNRFGGRDETGNRLLFSRMAQGPRTMDTMLTEEDEEKKEPEMFRYLAEGGRIGLQEGGGIEQRLEQLGGDVTSAEKMLQAINKRLETAESSLGSGGGGLGSIAQPFIGGIPQPLPAAGPNVGTLIPQPRPGPFMGRPILEPLIEGPVQPLATPLEADDPFKNPAFEKMKPFGVLPFDLSDPRGTRFNSIEAAFNNAQDNAMIMRMTGRRGPDILPGEMSFDDYKRLFSIDNEGFITNTTGADKFYQKDLTSDPNRFPVSSYGETYRNPDSPLYGKQTETHMGIAKDRYIPLPTSGLISGLPSGVPAAGYADGGNVVGGEYDFESARQMYGLGKLVKKVTRSVKKIAKSPVGKAAIAAALFKMGGGKFGNLPGASFFGKGSFNPLKMKMLSAPNPGSLVSSPFARFIGTPTGIATLIGGASTIAGLTADDEQDDTVQTANLEPGLTIPDRQYRFFQEGGSTEKEPVAKKTMPLLDMGGMEKDYREDGGFVPIGRMEKADDVPARLSKNEFVFTADAVRNAGDGDVDKGAEVMYNMMKNLEAGGEVSEESQGLEGARRMFQTSQRLEEVL